jgi:hypothetical protein
MLGADRLPIEAEGPLAARCVHHASDFLAVERLGKNIVTTQIQHLSPQVVVGVPGDDQNVRWFGERFTRPEDRFPTAIGQVSLTYYDGWLNCADLRHGRFHRLTSNDGWGVRAGKHIAEKSFVVSVRGYQKD